MWRLDWSLRIQFQGGSLPGFLLAGLSCFSQGFSVGLLKCFQDEAAGFPQKEWCKRRWWMLQCLLWPSLGSHMHFILMVIWNGPNSVWEGTLHSMGTRIRGSYIGHRLPHLPFDISSYPACEMLFFFLLIRPTVSCLRLYSVLKSKFSSSKCSF